MGNIFHRGGKSYILLPNDKESRYEAAYIYVRKGKESLYEGARIYVRKGKESLCKGDYIYVRKREASLYEGACGCTGKEKPFPLEARGKGLAGWLALR